jgi:hypothetical protein
VRIQFTFLAGLFLCTSIYAAEISEELKNQAATTIIQHELASSDSYLTLNAVRSTFGLVSLFISVDNRDLPDSYLQQLSSDRLRFLPKSARNCPKNVRMDLSCWRIDISAPVLRSDGDYDLRHIYYCGGLCGSEHSAVMRLKLDKWQIIHTNLDTFY